MKAAHLFFIAVIALSTARCGRKTETTTVLRKDIAELVFATGALKADDEYFLTAQSEGYLTALYFEEGDVVAAGKLMGTIDNKQSVVNAQQSEKLLHVALSNAEATAPLLQQAKTNISNALEKQKQDAVQAERFKKLFAAGSVAKVELENSVLALANSTAAVKVLEEQYRNLQVQAKQQLLAQQQQTGVNKTLLEYNRIIAPVGGKIYARKKQPGDYVRKGDVIAVLANPKKIYAELSLDERSMGGIKLRQTATIQLNTDEKKTYQSHIAEIMPAFDEATRSFLVKAFFDEPLDFQITGTQLQANILIGERKNVLVIPRKYLGFGNQVLLPDKKTTLVKTGVVSTEWVEILEGLTENQVILTELN